MNARLRDAGTAFGPKTQRKLLALAPFARKEIEQMYDAFRQDHARKRRAVGLEALHKALATAAKEWAGARRRMVTTAPRTPQGAAALADQLADFEYADRDLELGMLALARGVAIAARNGRILSRGAVRPSGVAQRR